MKENKKAILEILKKKSKKDGKFENLVLNLALQKIDSDNFEFDGGWWAFPPRATDTGELLRSAGGTGKHLKQQSKTPGKHHAYRAFFRSI